ncbi:MAG: isoleucine--tRNA ligase, partial [Chloroflexi bacterium]|nr:isoleucine--tRNA ligase [Chloroflexota bacterium]
MYKPVASKVNFPKMEEEILRSWKENNIFAKSIENRKDDPLFVLYEGPPTANGRPGIHHVLARVFKDVMPRYKTMKGYRAPRNAGWDTHGLPVELEIEKKLGLKSKPEIEKYGIGKFNAECRQSVLQYVDDWNKITERIAYWTDLEHPYITFDNNYIETCWWIIHQLSEKGLIYKGYRVTPHCPRCATSLSSHEVALGYKDNTEDPSVFVKFKLTSESVMELQKAGLDPDIPSYFLAWTTTPWTLPGNTALAVSPGEDYIIVEEETDGTKYQLIFAKPRLAEVLKQSGRIAGTIKGKDIVGLHYEPLFSPGLITEPVLIFKDHELMSVGKNDRWVYPVIAGDFVVMNEGTGIVHIAPAFGEIDYQIGQEKGLYFIQPVDLAGRMTISIPWIDNTEDNINGRFVKQADSRILKDLKSRGLLLRSEKIKHTYPFCWRCNTPLLYYAKSSWYIKTTEEKDNLIKGNEQINWYPEHIKYGRFGDWLKNNVDWAFSRERYWGTPLPVWECDKCHQREFIESRSVLIKKNLHQTEAAIQLIAGTLDLHRPYVDDIVYDCVKCNGVMRRVPEVIDCWFDSGSMPIAQWHYPFENKALLDDGRFPADFISEAVDQTRGWFYSLHALSILLFNKPCFKNVICLGLVMDEKGEKMSKSKGNVVEPWALLNKYGADALRWYLYTSAQPGNVRLFSVTGIEEITRKFQLTLWNSYSFFVSYANIDNFSPSIQTSDVKDLTELDKWIVSELNHLILDVTNLLENYDPTSAARKIEEF